jgi:hypothetical protein
MKSSSGSATCLWCLALALSNPTDGFEAVLHIAVFACRGQRLQPLDPALVAIERPAPEESHPQWDRRAVDGDEFHRTFTERHNDHRNDAPDLDIRPDLLLGERRNAGDRCCEAAPLAEAPSLPPGGDLVGNAAEGTPVERSDKERTGHGAALFVALCGL